MTTTNPEQSAVEDPTPDAPAAADTGAGPSRGGRLTRWLRSPWVTVVKDSLERPLTSYYLLIGASALLLIIGVLMVLSASSVDGYEKHGSSYYWATRQLIWVGLGIPCAYVASRLPIRWIRRIAWPAYGVSLVLLMAVALFGVEVNGNKNWLAVGPVAIQPSEIAKLGLILWAATVYANKDRRLGELHHMIMPVVPGMILATAMVVIGRDLGTGLVLFAIMLGLLWVVGAPGRLFGLALSIVSVLALFLATTDSERLERITSFTDPFRDFHNSGWQPAHGLFALSSGGWFGQGIGASQQKWGDLPEAHTDYIFAVLGEELGLVGTLLVIGLFLTIAFAAIRVAIRTPEPFIRYATFGILIWLIGQMIINIGMVLALLPVIGIPLPLVSYGGSALLPALVALGLLIGFARRDPEAARALAAKKRSRSVSLTTRP